LNRTCDDPDDYTTSSEDEEDDDLINHSGPPSDSGHEYGDKDQEQTPDAPDEMLPEMEHP
jgi:hypothetical protein